MPISPDPPAEQTAGQKNAHIHSFCKGAANAVTRLSQRPRIASSWSTMPARQMVSEQTCQTTCCIAGISPGRHGAVSAALDHAYIAPEHPDSTAVTVFFRAEQVFVKGTEVKTGKLGNGVI